jgi:hypothetical protein
MSQKHGKTSRIIPGEKETVTNRRQLVLSATAFAATSLFDVPLFAQGARTNRHSGFPIGLIADS